MDHSKSMKELNATVLTITILGTILTLHYSNERFTSAKNLCKKYNFSLSQETVIFKNKKYQNTGLYRFWVHQKKSIQ